MRFDSGKPFHAQINVSLSVKCIPNDFTAPIGVNIQSVIFYEKKKTFSLAFCAFASLLALFK